MITALLLILSCASFSQNTISVKRSTLISIKKDLDKCDSLKVAYQFKSALLDSLVETNFKLFDKLELERTKTVTLSADIKQVNEDLLKATKNPFGNINAFLTGGLCGAVVVLLLVLL